MRPIDGDALKSIIQQEPTDGMYTHEILAVIDEQPTIESYGTWIPCSERLPGMGKRMLTTDIRGHVTVNKVLLFCDDVPVFDSYYRTGAERIIAWMPLPLPYREEKNDE